MPTRAEANLPIVRALMSTGGENAVADHVGRLRVERDDLKTALGAVIELALTLCPAIAAWPEFDKARDALGADSGGHTPQPSSVRSKGSVMAKDLEAVRRAVKRRVRIAKGASQRSALEGRKYLADFHAGGHAFGACLLEDIDRIERRLAKPRKRKR